MDQNEHLYNNNNTMATDVLTMQEAGVQTVMV